MSGAPWPVLPFDRPADAPACDGATYEAPIDRVRLGRQALRVFDAMKDGRARTLAEIARDTGAPEASISARLRDFRKPRFGAHVIERRRVGPERGLYSYRLIPNPQVRLVLDDDAEEA